MRRKMQSKQNNFQNPTPQAKMISVGDKLGMKGLKKQQGATVIKYDYVPLPEGLLPKTTFQFFEGSNARTFPFTNLTDGKLQVGEAMVLERMYFTIVSRLVATGEFTNIQTITTFGVPAIEFGVFNFLIANSQVVKPTPLASSKPEFNRKATFADYNVFHFDTDTVIPTLIEFTLNVTVPPLTVPVSATLEFFIGCTIEGAGSILAPRTTF